MVLEGRPSVHPLQDGREVRFALGEHRPHRSADLERNGRKALRSFLDQNSGDQLKVARKIERRLDLLADRLRPVPERLGQGIEDRHLPNADAQCAENEPDEELPFQAGGTDEEVREDLDLDVLRPGALRFGDSSELRVNLRHLEGRRLLEPSDPDEELADGRPEVPGLLRPSGDEGLLAMGRGSDRASGEGVGHPELDPLVLRTKEPLGQVEHSAEVRGTERPDQVHQDRAHLEAFGCRLEAFERRAEVSEPHGPPPSLRSRADVGGSRRYPRR